MRLVVAAGIEGELADEPSTHFGSLGIPGVSKVGVEIDRKLGALLEVLDVRCRMRFSKANQHCPLN